MGPWSEMCFSRYMVYCMVFLIVHVPIPDEEKINRIFNFTLLCGASKRFMKALNKAFIKPFKVPQRSVKKKIKPIFI